MAAITFKSKCYEIVFTAIIVRACTAAVFVNGERGDGSDTLCFVGCVLNWSEPGTSLPVPIIYFSRPPSCVAMARDTTFIHVYIWNDF